MMYQESFRSRYASAFSTAMLLLLGLPAVVLGKKLRAFSS